MTTNLLTRYLLAPIWARILIFISFYFIILQFNTVYFDYTFATCMQENTESSKSLDFQAIMEQLRMHEIRLQEQQAIIENQTKVIGKLVEKHQAFYEHARIAKDKIVDMEKEVNLLKSDVQSLNNNVFVLNQTQELIKEETDMLKAFAVDAHREIGILKIKQDNLEEALAFTQSRRLQPIYENPNMLYNPDTSSDTDYKSEET